MINVETRHSARFDVQHPEADYPASLGNLMFNDPAPPGMSVHLVYPADLIRIDQYGEFIKVRRSGNQRELASACNMPQSSLPDIETGKTMVNYETAHTIYEALGGQILYLALIESSDVGLQSIPLHIVGPDRYHVEIGKYFSKRLEDRGLTQREAAASLNVVNSVVSDFAAGRVRPKPRFIARRLAPFGITTMFCGILRPQLRT